MLYGFSTKAQQDTTGDPNAGNIKIHNCYQTVEVESNKKIKLLRTGNSTFVQMEGQSTTAFKYIQVFGYDQANATWTAKDFWGHLTPLNQQVKVINPNTGLEEFEQVWFNFGQIVYNLDLPGNHDKYIINFLVDAIEVGAPPVTVTHSNVEIEFVQVDDYVSFKPTNDKTCFDMNDFSFEKFVNPEIEGFCGSFSELKLKFLPGSFIRNGLPQGFEIDVEENVTPFPLTPNDCNDPNAVQCNQAPANAPEPVPCRCMTMVIEGKLHPCDRFFNTAPCPDIPFSKQIEVCCQCDTRANGGIDEND